MKKFLRRKLFQKLPVQKIMWKKMPGFLKKKLLLRRFKAASEEDEWLYSQPRRFAKKPAHEQED